MLLFPKKLKYKKWYLVIPTKSSISFDNLRFGTFGIVSLNSGYITSRQLESCRRIIVKAFRRSITNNLKKVWIRVFPFLSITLKPNGVRMGKGKGNHAYWVAPVRKGSIIFEIIGLTQLEMNRISNSINIRLSMITKVTSLKKEECFNLK